MSIETIHSWQYPEPVANDRESWTIGETEHYFVDLCPMIFNHRIVLTPKTCTQVWDVGWCYPNRIAAALALGMWADPENSEPPGAVKRVGPVWP